ncbi:MAG TPA: sigma-70 family RNA polymerase sigma factor [Candidatus Dormibacteraeota bacterium]|jgi:RNA polymerase sigma-70 factor (ECF subfamily)|nr:sigma-70 family RNA polymerase sigma factor [Candidatus Dormibacteraeota bacterium]
MRSSTRPERVWTEDQEEREVDERLDAALLQRHYQAVWRFCKSRTGTVEDAEDAVQDTFIRFLERRERDLSNPQAWLIHAASCACADLARRNRVRTHLSTEEGHGEARMASAEDVVLASSLVTQLMTTLRPKDATILRRLYVDGGSITEVAAALGLAPGHVRIMAMRARRRARTLLESIGAAAGALLPGRLRRASHGFFRRSAAARPAVDGMSAETAGMLSGTGLVAVGMAAALALITPARTIDATPGHPARAGAPVAQGPLPSPTTTPTGAPPPGAGPRGRTAVAARPSPGAVTLPGLPTTGQSASSRNSYFDHMAASPTYAADGTVFAVGRQAAGCAPGCQPVLFRTVDHGHSWQQLHPARLQDSSIAVSPFYDADGTVFIAGASGLDRSVDGGRTFTPEISLISGLPVAVPTAAGGYHLAFMVTAVLQQGLFYFDPAGATGQNILPGPTLPTYFTPNGMVAGTAPDTVVISGTVATTGPFGGQPAVVVCKLSGSCGTVATFNGDPFAANEGFVSIAGAGPSSPDYFAYSAYSVYGSDDGGASFPQRVGAPALVDRIVPAPDFAQSQTVLVGSSTQPVGSYVLTRARYASGSLQTVSRTTLPYFLVSWLMLPDGRIIGAQGGGLGALGLACSSDGGQTWAASC